MDGATIETIAMTPEQFAYWLQGFTELSPDMERPSAAQWQAIKDHLQTVFVKVTPPVGSPRPLLPGLRTMELRPSDIYPGLTDRATC